MSAKCVSMLANISISYLADLLLITAAHFNEALMLWRVVLCVISFGICYVCRLFAIHH